MSLRGFENRDTLIVSGKLRVRADRKDQALDAALQMAKASREEEGCREYRVMHDAADGSTLYFFEIWDNVDAMIRHFQTEHMASFQETVKKVAVGELEVKRYLVAA